MALAHKPIEHPVNHQPPDIRDGRNYSEQHSWTEEDHAAHRRYYNLPAPLPIEEPERPEEHVAKSKKKA